MASRKSLEHDPGPKVSEAKVADFADDDHATEPGLGMPGEVLHWESAAVRGGASL